MNFLVTGGTGFVGRALVKRLTDDGHVVQVVSREPGRVLPPARALAADLVTVSNWEPLVAGVDFVIHLAARVHVMHETAADSMARYRAVNTLPTRNLATAAARAGVRRFVFLSTIKVHGGRTLDRPFRADDPGRPEDEYARSKWEAEEELRVIGQESGLEVCILRPPLVYGPGVGGNVRRLLSLISRGVPLPLGSVVNRRSMVGATNLVDLIATVAGFEGCSAGAYLVGDIETLSTPEFARLIGAALGRPALIVPCPISLLRGVGRAFGLGPEVDRLVSSLEADSARTRDHFGWTPPMSMPDELRALASVWSERT